MKKYGLLFLACLFLFSMWVPATDAAAKNVNALDIKWTKSTNVPLNKRWTISFNKEIHKDSDLVKYVYVENTAGEKIPVEVSINTARTKIYVEPVNAYEPGETYKLIINNGLISSGGKKLKDTVVKEFTTEGEATVTFNTSYKVTNTTDEIQYVTLSEGAYYQVIENGDDYTSFRDQDYNLTKKKSVKLEPGQVLYCDFIKSGTVESFKLVNQIKKMDTSFFKIIDLNPNETMEFKPLNQDTSVPMKFILGKNEQVKYLEIINKDYEEYNYVQERFYMDVIDLHSVSETFVENSGETSIQLIFPKKHAQYFKTDKKIDFQTYDLNVNETVKIDRKKSLSFEATPHVQAIPKEGDEVYMEYDFTHTYSYNHPDYGLNYWDFTGKVNNKIDSYGSRQYDFIFGHNISNDSYFLMKNTGPSVIHLYGRHLEFEKTEEELFTNYVIQPNEIVEVNTKFIGDHHSFHVKNKGYEQTMNVFLAEENNVKHMGEMKIDSEDLLLPAYEKVVIENTSNTPVEIYGNKRTIEFEKSKSSFDYYDEIIVYPNERYNFENNNAKYGEYFIGTVDYKTIYYRTKYSKNRSLEAKRWEAPFSYSAEHGFYQFYIDEERLINSDNDFIENTGENPLVIYIPKNDLDYSKQ